MERTPTASEPSKIACASCGHEIADLLAPPACPNCQAALPILAAISLASPAVQPSDQPAIQLPIPAPGEQALTDTVGRGASWVMLGSALSKFATMLAQVVLGWKLTDVDFGVFATAGSIAWFIGILKDAGTNVILLQRGKENYEKIAGPLFWMNFSLSLVCAALIAALAYPLARSQNSPEMATILLIIAISTPMQVVGGHLQTKLRQDLRFAKFSQITLVSALIRQVATVALALLGFGALSFAIPYILCAIYDGVASYRATREPVWKRPAEIHTWKSYFREGSWTVLGTASNFALDQGAYIVLGLMLTEKITGQFYFAFQLVAQTGVILGYAVQQVLVPALVKLNEHAERQADAALRALRVMTFVGSIVCLGMTACIDPLVKIVWPQRWIPAIPAIQILGVFFVWRINFGLTTAILHAQGRFKRHALLTAIEGGGIMLIALVAALIPDVSLATISWKVGGWLLAGRLVVTLFVFRALGVSAGPVLGATVPSWLCAVAGGLAALALDHFLHLEARCLNLAQSLATVAGFHPASPRLIEAPAHALRLLILGGACVAVFCVLTRALIRTQVVEALSILPARFRGHATRLLLVASSP